MRYVPKPGSPPSLTFILDTETGQLVRDKNHRLRSFNDPKTAAREARKLNGEKS